VVVVDEIGKFQYLCFPLWHFKFPVPRNSNRRYEGTGVQRLSNAVLLDSVYTETHRMKIIRALEAVGCFDLI
jgi:hypothetical protein